MPSSASLEKPTHTTDNVTTSERLSDEDELQTKTSKVHTKGKDEEIVDLTSGNTGSATRQSLLDSFIKLKQKEVETADARIDELVKKVDEVLTLVSAGGYSRQSSLKVQTDTTLPSNAELPGE